MRTIHKQALFLTDVQTLTVPRGARFLSAQYQPGGQSVGAMVIWYECDMQPSQNEARTIVIVGTGNPIPDTHKLSYISTAQMGSLVWHVYEAVT